MIRLIIFLMASCLGCQVVAQNNVSKPSDKVELKDGSKLYGSVISWDMANELVLRLESGGEARIPAASVKKVTQAKAEYQAPYFQIESGRLYGMFNAGGLLGRSPWGNVSMGGFMHIQAGYGLTSRLGAGFGIGSELYLPHSDADIASLPCYATLQWTPASRYLIGAMAGYSFVGHGESQGINVNYIDAKGGIFAGLQLQYALSRHFALNLGLQTSSKKREWVQTWDERNRGYDRFNHYRMAIGMSYRL